MTSINGIVACQIDDLSTTPATLIGTLQGVVSGSTVTFSNGTPPALIGGHPYLFQFYVAAPATPTPSPTATASPTPSPSPTATGSSSPGPSPSPTSSGSATAPPLFTVTGATTTSSTITPPAVPGPLTVPASGPGYGTYTSQVTFQFPAATSTAPYTMTAALGSTAADINPSNSFPYYTGSAATPLFYAQLTPSVEVTFAQTPSINVTVTSFGSKNSCSLFTYGSNNGSPYQWQLVPGTTVNVSGTSVSIPGGRPNRIEGRLTTEQREPRLRRLLKASPRRTLKISLWP